MALSRIRKLTGLHLIDFHINSIYCDKNVWLEINRLRNKANPPIEPLPQFNVKPSIASIFVNKIKKEIVAAGININEKVKKSFTKFLSLI